MRDTQSYSIDKYFKISFLIFFIVVVVTWSLSFTEAYFTNYDAYDYAQMGREISSGHGFSTRQIFPRHIPFLSQKGYLNSERIPNLYRYPLPTIAHSLSQRLISNIIQAAIIQSGIWFLLSLIALFFLAKHFSNAAIAFLSALFYAGDRSIWQYSYGGMTESLSITLLLLIPILSYSKKPSRWKWFLVGLLCGAAFLTRSQLLPLFPLSIIFSWFLIPKSKRLLTIIFILIGFCLVLTPWMTRNYVLADNPFFSFSTSRNLVLGTSPSHSDLEMQLHAPIESLVIWKEYKRGILQKFFHNVRPELVNPFTWLYSSFYSLLVLLVVLSSLIFMRIQRDPQYNLFKWNILLLIFANFLVVSFAFQAERFFVIFYPLTIILIFQEMFFLIHGAAFRHWRKLIHILLAILILIGLAKFSWTVLSTEDQRTSVASEQRSYEVLAAMTGSQSIIASDISYKITLYNGNLTVRLPAAPAQLLEISRAYLPLDYLVFSPSITRAVPSHRPSLFETYENYRFFMGSDDFLREFEFLTELPNGAEVYRNIRSAQ